MFLENSHVGAEMDRDKEEELVKLNFQIRKFPLAIQCIFVPHFLIDERVLKAS